MARTTTALLTLCVLFAISTPALADVLGCGSTGELPMDPTPMCLTCISYKPVCQSDIVRQGSSTCPELPGPEVHSTPCTTTYTDRTAPGGTITSTGECRHREERAASPQCGADTEGEAGTVCTFTDANSTVHTGKCEWRGCDDSSVEEGDAVTDDGEDATSRSTPLIVFLAGLSLLFAVRARSRD